MSYAGIFTDKNNIDHPITSTLYGTCSTAAATAAKEVVCSNVDSLEAGMTLRVVFTNANTAASPTINVNSKGAKNVYRFGSTTPIGGNSWEAGAVVDLFYDGTSFFMLNSDNLGTAAAKAATNAVTENSTDLVESGAVYTGLATKADLTDLAPAFSTATAYAVGQYVSYDGNLYKCTSAHSAGAWEAGDFTLVAVGSELESKQPKTDNNLTTTSKDTTGAINELKSGLTTLDDEVNGDATTYPYADVITIEDAVPANLADCSVKIEPVQDLHGYDKPWVGGAGKNKLPLVLADIKTNNTTGTWTGNDYAINGVVYTVQTDDDDNVIGIKATGAPTGNADLLLTETVFVESGVSYILNGCPLGGSTSTYRLYANWYYDGTSHVFEDGGAGVTCTWNYTSGANTFAFMVRIANGVTIPAGGFTFLPMLRLATETDATFAPYTNICPISGHTEASVRRTGENLAFDTISGKNINANGVIINADFDLKVARVTSGVTYTAYTDNSSSVYAFYSDSPASGSTSYNNSRTEAIVSNSCFEFTAPINGYIAYRTNVGYARTECVESSKNNQYTILFKDAQGQTITVYGSDLDVKNGTLKVGRTTVNAGDLTYNEGSVAFYSSDITDFKRSGSIGNQYATYCISSAFKYYGNSDYEQDTNGFSLYYNPSVPGCRLAFNKTTFDGYTTTQFKQWLTDNNVQVCYELATPTTIQLTPQQIQLLKGTNTLYASTGQISVTVNGVSGSIGSVQEQVNGLADNFNDVIGWSDRRNLFDAKHVAIEELPNSTGTLQYGCKFDVVAGQKYTVSSNMTESLFLFSKTGTDAAENIFTLTSSKSFSFTAATNTIYYVRNATSTTVNTFRNKLLNGEVQFEEGSVATDYQTFHPIIGNAVDGLIDRVPSAPTTDGAYVLTVTVADGTPTYSWVSGS